MIRARIILAAFLLGASPAAADPMLEALRDVLRREARDYVVSVAVDGTITITLFPAGQGRRSPGAQAPAGVPLPRSAGD